MKKSILGVMSKLGKATKKTSEASISTTSSVREPAYFVKSPDSIDQTEDEDGEEVRPKSTDGEEEEEEEYCNDPLYKDEIEKELARRIEQAPAAKVIVSDALMREALTEMNSRRSSRTIVEGYGARLDEGVGGDGDASTSHRGEQQQQPSGQDGGPMNLNEMEEGCPLDKILVFLQAVMTKDYKRALVLAKEVEQLEPNNELIREYTVVLNKIVKKEREDEAAGSDSENEAASDTEEEYYTDSITTSEETESVSGDDSRTSRSSSYSSSDEEDENEDEMEKAREIQLRMKKALENTSLLMTNGNKTAASGDSSSTSSPGAGVDLLDSLKNEAVANAPKMENASKEKMKNAGDNHLGTNKIGGDDGKKDGTGVMVETEKVENVKISKNLNLKEYLSPTKKKKSLRSKTKKLAKPEVANAIK